MKFLYLKGIDILGPFEAEQIIKEPCFSEELLVCPEEKAEQEAAWKPASYYPEFKMSLEKEVFPIKEAKPIVNSTTIGVPPPISIPNKEENFSQKLPPLEDTETESSSVNFNDADSAFNEVMSELAAPEETKQEEEDDDIEDHTFHIAHKEDNLLEDLPAHRLIGAERDSLIVQNGVVVEPAQKQTDVGEGKSTTAGGIEETDNLEDKKEFLEISNNKIISSSDGRVKKRRSNDLVFILSFIVLIVIAVALGMAFWNMMNEGKKASEVEANEITQITSEQNKQEQNISQEVHALLPKVAEQEIAKQETLLKEEEQLKSVAPEEQVIDIVKNTKLASKGQTIGEYLQNLYGMEYQYSWSAKPFTDNVYIVEFFASQVRNEPFVYLFRVDIDQKKITGALNNITLDLLA